MQLREPLGRPFPRRVGQVAVVALGTWMMMAVAIMFSSLAPLAGFVKADLGLTQTAVGATLSAFYLGSALASIPGGLLADRFGSRFNMWVGLTLAGGMTLLASRSPRFAPVVVCLAMAGVGYGVLNPSINKAMLAWFPPQGRATAMSIKQVGVTLGGALAALVLPRLALQLGWRNAFGLTGIMLAGTALLAGLTYRDPATDPPASAHPGRRAAAAGNGFPVRRVAAAAALSFVFAAGQQMLVAYLSLYLQDVWLYPAVVAGNYLALAQFGGTPGRILWGVVSDRAAGVGRGSVVSAVGGAAGLLMFLPALLPPYTRGWLLACIVFALGMTASGWNGVYQAIMVELAGPRQAGLATGIGLTSLFLGSWIGPILFGFVVDLTGSYRTAWFMAGALLLSTAAAYLVFSTRSRKA